VDGNFPKIKGKDLGLDGQPLLGPAPASLVMGRSTFSTFTSSTTSLRGGYGTDVPYTVSLLQYQRACRQECLF
jgi:hypothetical protein